MRIVIDRNIPYAREALETIGEVVALPGTGITRETLAGAEALLTRTRTRCDASLLEGTDVKFIATATIGTDHIDTDYCASRGIEVANAPGCNAAAVAQWVLAAIRAWLQEGESFVGKTLGVIGAGHVGSILIRWARGLGMKVLVNDPPREQAEGTSSAGAYTDLRTIAEQADIITVHTPLTTSGQYPTYHLIGREMLGHTAKRPLVLNAARGPVADTEALLEALRDGKISAVGIDCWEDEPQISHELLEAALVATPHIAGYSREGKIRATRMAVDALCRHFGMPSPSLSVADPLPVAEIITEDAIGYDILADTEALKRNPGEFESLRNTYHLRPEPTA